jgi:hypothetical protein
MPQKHGTGRDFFQASSFLAPIPKFREDREGERMGPNVSLNVPAAVGAGLSLVYLPQIRSVVIYVKSLRDIAY